MAKEKKTRRSIFVPLMLLFLMAVVGAQLLRMREKTESAQAAQSALEQQISSQQQANDALSSALEKADDREYLEELARDQLGYVTPGEKDFYDVSN